MANKYLDDVGLGHFKGENDKIYAGSLTLSSNKTFSLLSKSGATLSTFTLATVDSNSSNPGLMSVADATKLAGITAGATLVADSTTNGNITIDGVETTVYTHPSYTSKSAGIYKITVDGTGHISAAATPTAAEWRSALPAAAANGSGLMSSTHYSKLEGIASGANVNVIETVKVNNSALTVTNKAVNIDLSAYALKTEISQMSQFKGVVANWAALPSSGQTAGDMYIVTTADSTHALPANGNVIWDGTEWDVMGELFAIATITNNEIDALFA